MPNSPILSRDPFSISKSNDDIVKSLSLIANGANVIYRDAYSELTNLHHSHTYHESNQILEGK